MYRHAQALTEQGQSIVLDYNLVPDCRLDAKARYEDVAATDIKEACDALKPIARLARST